MRVVCISDTHQRHGLHIPEGDVLIHAGDVTDRGDLKELTRFRDWFSKLKFEHKIIVAGNHDSCLVDIVGELKLIHFIYLKDTMVEINGIKFYGTPYQKYFCNMAFNKTDAELKTIYSRIPEDIDILITHNPPLGILDTVYDGEKVGCPVLLETVNRVKPKFHVFGHIHEAHGYLETPETTFINASHLGNGNSAISFEIKEK